MKNLIFIILLGLFTHEGYSQTYEMDSVDGMTITTCGGTFYDSQSISVNGNFYYNMNENYSVTFCSSNPGDVIHVDFSFLAIVPGQDTLWVYDGPNTSSNLIHYYSGYYTTGSQPIISSGQCITFVFKSTGGNVSIGWEGVISCITVPDVAIQPACTNMGFDDSPVTFYNSQQWYSTSGTVATGLPGALHPKYVSNTFAPSTNTHSIHFFGLDPFAGFNTISPFNGGTPTLKIGNYTPGAGGASVEQKFQVTQSNALYVYSYAVVLENALDGNGNPHPPEQQPFFKIEALDCNDQPIECAEYLVVGGPNIDGFIPSTGNPNIFYKPWSQVFLDLTPYIGSCVTVRFTTGDCVLGGHRAYAYLDGYCAPLEITGQDTICPGEPVTLEAPPGGAAYSWSPTGDTTQSITVSPSTQTVYECTITPFNNGGAPCPTVLYDTVNVYDTYNMVDSASICFGESATLTATPFLIGGTFSWNPGGQTTPSITVSPSVTTSYTCTYTDPNGCELDTTGVVEVSPSPQLEAPDTIFACSPLTVDLTNSFQDLNATIGNISYWEDQNATITLVSPTNVAISGTYYIVKETNEGCSDTISIEVMINPLPTPQAGIDDTICGGLTYNLNAVLTSNLGNWTAPVGVSFSPGPNSNDAIVIVPSPGSYTLTWTETNSGCFASDDVELYFSDISLVENVVPSSCGNNDGEIELIPSNGNSPYQYSIDNGISWQSSNTFSNLAGGNYAVQVMDNIGCFEVVNVQILNMGGPTIDDIVELDVSCNGECNGAISINAMGAALFSIDNGITTQVGNVFNNLCPGVYDILIEDSFGCRAAGVASITEPLPLTFNTVVESLNCFEECQGEIILSALGGNGGYEYSNDNGQTFSMDSIFTGLCSSTFELMIRDSLGCSVTGQAVVNQPTELTATLGSTDVSCFGVCDGAVSTTVPNGSGTPPYTYQWVGNNVSQSTQLVNGICTGWYSVTVTDGNGCNYLDSIEVSGPSLITIDSISVSDELCGGDCQGSISIYSSTAVSYSIDGVNYSSNNLFENLCSGAYTIHIKNAQGCEEDTLVMIDGPAPLELQIMGDSIVCLEEITTLSAIVTGGVGGYTYDWVDSQGNTYSTQSITVSVSSAEVFNLTVVDSNNCMAIGTFIISVHPPIEVIGFNDVSICLGDTAYISAIASGGNGGPYTYLWDNGLGTGQFNIVTPTQSTTYTVVASDNCGSPSDTGYVNITVVDLPNVSFTGDTLEGCVPLTVNFDEIGVPAGSSCIWSFGDGTIANECDNVFYEYDEPGCWDVGLSIITPEGCLFDTLMASYICTHPYPEANFTYLPQEPTLINTEVDFSNLSEDADWYNWIFEVANELSYSNEETPSFTFPNHAPGSYPVCLVAENNYGCLDTTCKTIVIKDEMMVFVPNAFTPDGIGPNNSFKPVLSRYDINEYTFQIFNRWGELIFENNNPDLGWDGTYRGVDCQVDTYVWKLELTIDHGKISEYIGHVNLIR